MPEGPLFLVAICPDCGPIAKVEVEGGPGARWGPAEKWCYVARVAHDREVHSKEDDA